MKDEFYWCDFCSAKMLIGSAECYNCKTGYPPEHWAALEEEQAQAASDEQAAERISSKITECENINICCDKRFSECDCDEVIGGEQVYDVQAQVYDPEGYCFTCVWQDTPVCPELRKLTLKYERQNKHLSNEPLVKHCVMFTPVLSNRKDN